MEIDFDRIVFAELKKAITTCSQHGNMRVWDEHDKSVKLKSIKIWQRKRSL